ncbi:hypothetical protein N8T08_004806 [Aspergillus melleus]|uniref:Uncharacterized protein n=1 Tax=Aspergillus melleus TaxID=138277 RepID=A0ACC3B3N3_9EURO|nr:hypothetical protein N8T08_004806 [Aspergillus melleus]
MGDGSDLLNGSFVTGCPWLCADKIHPQAPLKILMLHGHGQSGQKLYYKTRIFHAAIQNQIATLTNRPVEFVYLDAPICQIPGDFDSRIWVYGSHEEPEIRGLNESIHHIMSALQNKGPFLGIMGFSTGATLAVVIASILENPKRHAEFDVKTPILHFIGTLDSMIAEPLTLRLAQQCQTQNIRYFAEGHFVPRHSEIVSEVAGFIGDSFGSGMISKTGDD